MPEHWGTKRPEQLHPEQFLQLTREMFGEQADPEALRRNSALDRAAESGVDTVLDKTAYLSDGIWRKALYPNMSMSNKQKRRKGLE